jgi:DNA repair exonuclease SbcCD ATPase subunit
MKITALRLYNVKRFAGHGVAIEGIDNGVNLLCAANEYGKSTSFEALHALFFQPHTGASKDLRRLQPYSGGHPLIQADIIVSEGRYRLTKQFIGGKRATVENLDSGLLVAQADEAEQFIAGLIRGGSAGPAGLLWVRQGITGLEERDKKEVEGERRVRESLLTSVQGEVEAITGGRRMSEIIDACHDELALLVTPTLRPKAGGPYGAIVDRHARLVEEERRLAAEVAALRDALDDRTRALKRLTELENADEKAARRASVETAEATFEAAKAHAEVLKKVEAETALAGNRRDIAERDLNAFCGAMQQADKLRADLHSAEVQCKEAQVRRINATAAIDRAMAEVQAAEIEEQDKRDLLARLDAALKARRAVEELRALQERLDQAEATRAALEAEEAALALIAMPAKAVDQLQQLEIEIAGLRAAEATSLPTLRVAYDEGVINSVVMDGVRLADAEERGIRDIARLEIAGIGTLTFRSNRPANADSRLKATEQTRRELLAAIGVANLAEARRKEAEAQEKSAELSRLRLGLHHLAPVGLQKLREEVARLIAVVLPETLDLQGDPKEARQALVKAGQHVSDARNSLHEAQQPHSRAGDAVVEAETALATLRSEFARIEATLGREEERPVRGQALANAFAEQKSLFERLEAHMIGLRDIAPDLESTVAVLRRAKSVEDAATQEETRLRVTLADLSGQIRTRSDDAVEEAWRETSEALAAAATRMKMFETEVAVLDKLRTTLQASRSTARDLYLRPVLSELQPLLGLLFEDISIVFDEKTLLPQTIRRNGQDEEVERLSGGMREQLSVLTRLAFARLLARDGRPAPVILDDALVYSDDDRIERMFDALHRQARDQQIIVFSCRQRAFSKLGGNVLHMAAWQPDFL